MRPKAQILLPQPHISLFAGLQPVAKQATGSLPLLPSTSNKPLFLELWECNNCAWSQKSGMKSDIGISDHWDLAVNRVCIHLQYFALQYLLSDNAFNP